MPVLTAPGATPTIEVRTSAPSWPARSGAASLFLILLGLYWDISWHMSIGRDTFWTPAHIAIQLGGVLAAGVASALIFRATFGQSARALAQRRRGVRVWGFHGPLGAFIAAWGGATMATSAPFDNWWHNAYGVDVQILSPPHAVLMLGFFAVAVGAILLSTARAPLLLFEGGVLLTLLLILVNTYLKPTMLHTALPYRAVAFGVPGLLLLVAGVARRRWGATLLCTIYMGLMLAGQCLMPRFPAQPRLGPVYTPVAHMLTLGFPLLLIASGVVLDLLRPRLRGWRRPRQAAVLGVAFTAALVAVQWPFADWLMSPRARDAFWGMTNFPYSTRPSSYALAYQFQSPGHPLVLGLAITTAVAGLSCWCGLWAGEWLRRLER